MEEEEAVEDADEEEEEGEEGETCAIQFGVRSFVLCVF